MAETKTFRLLFLDRESRRKASKILMDHNFYFPYGEDVSLKGVDDPEYVIELLSYEGFNISEVMVEEER